MSNQQLQQLIAELQRGNDRQRRAASYKLGKINDPAAVTALINAFNDKDGLVRQNVINGLRSIGSREALEFLASVGQNKQVLPCPKCNHPQSIARPGFAIVETNQFTSRSDLVSASIWAVTGVFFAGVGLFLLWSLITEWSAFISLVGLQGIVGMATALILGADILRPTINKILAYNSIKRNGKPATIFTCTKCKHEWYQQENPS